MANKGRKVFIDSSDKGKYGKILLDSDEKVEKPKKKKEKKPSTVWTVVRPVVITVASIVIVMFLMGWAYNHLEEHYLEPVDPGSDKVVEVTIPSSSSLSSIAEILKENGLIKSEFFFKMYTDFSDMSYKLKAGTYELSPSMSYDDIIYTLIKGQAASVEVTYRFVEGCSVDQEAEQLADPETGLFDSPERFKELCRTGEKFENYPFIKSVIDNPDKEGRLNVLDGYLFPDTYRFYYDCNEEEVIIKQLNRFGEIFTDEYINRAEELGMTVDEVVTLASIIEKEAITEDFKKVSAVFHNRLKADMPLGSDTTMQVVTGKRQYTFNSDELAMESPYNTYLNKGLPIGPICNPGKAAIEAALYPDEEFINENYLYFCLTTPETGTQVFAKTYEEHQANVAEWEQYWK